jgi:hypothetical protein
MAKVICEAVSQYICLSRGRCPATALHIVLQTNIFTTLFAVMVLLGKLLMGVLFQNIECEDIVLDCRKMVYKLRILLAFLFRNVA